MSGRHSFAAVGTGTRLTRLVKITSSTSLSHRARLARGDERPELVTARKRLANP